MFRHAQSCTDMPASALELERAFLAGLVADVVGGGGQLDREERGAYRGGQGGQRGCGLPRGEMDAARAGPPLVAMPDGRDGPLPA